MATPCVVDTSAWIEWLVDSPVGRRMASDFPERPHCIVPTIVQQVEVLSRRAPVVHERTRMTGRAGCAWVPGLEQFGLNS